MESNSYVRNAVLPPEYTTIKTADLDKLKSDSEWLAFIADTKPGLLGFDDIEECFPEGCCFGMVDGEPSTNAQWLHDFAKKVESLVLAKITANGPDALASFSENGVAIFLPKDENTKGEVSEYMAHWMISWESLYRIGAPYREV